MLLNPNLYLSNPVTYSYNICVSKTQINFSEFILIITRTVQWATHVLPKLQRSIKSIDYIENETYPISNSFLFCTSIGNKPLIFHSLSTIRWDHWFCSLNFIAHGSNLINYFFERIPIKGPNTLCTDKLVVGTIKMDR